MILKIEVALLRFLDGSVDTGDADVVDAHVRVITPSDLELVSVGEVHYVDCLLGR